MVSGCTENKGDITELNFENKEEVNQLSKPLKICIHKLDVDRDSNIYRFKFITVNCIIYNNCNMKWVSSVSWIILFITY